jgi:hypothetical protein
MMEDLRSVGACHELFVADGRVRFAWKDRASLEFRRFGEIEYFHDVLRFVCENFHKRELTFYLTSDLAELPSYGENVVPIVLADEWCRIPHYAHRVGVIFKTYGTRPYMPAHKGRRLTYQHILSGIQFARDVAFWVPGGVADYIKRLSDKVHRCEILDIPLGCYRFEDFDMKPMSARNIDASFAGSIKQATYGHLSLKRYMHTAKSRARTLLLESLARIAKERPQAAIRYKATASFSPDSSRKDSYVDELADTKVCLVPRGTSPETFRLFEGVRSGCAIISEPLPHRWFYDGAPFIFIDDWRDLGKVLLPLLEDPLRLEEFHRKTKHWWNTKCSPAAVGAFIVQSLNACFGDTVQRRTKSPTWKYKTQKRPTNVKR